MAETIWWCENHRSAGNDQRCEFHLRQPAPWAFTCEMIELRVAGRDDLLIRREADGSWPDWVLVGLGWPDDLVEEAAKAMYAAQYPGYDFSKALRPSASQFRALARAALSVLFPGEEEE